MYKTFLLENVIPAIKAKWPVKKERIYIQQDNAKPHIDGNDPDIVAAGTADGWDIRLMNQPARSPDVNVLDLGYFASIQSLQYREATPDIQSLVVAVEKSYASLSPTKLDDTFMTLQKVLECIIKYGGGNEYAIPHMNKKKLRKENKLPVAFTCDEEIYACGLEIAAMGLEDKYHLTRASKNKKKTQSRHL